jgi:transcriptional regulator with XRE-family HTH domain
MTTFHLLSEPHSDVDIQAGFGGLSIRATVEHYFRNSGQVLYLLRVTSDLSLESVAQKVGISADKLINYEQGVEEPSARDLTRLANALGANLRPLLDAFGISLQSASEPSYGIAAQFGGELSEEEKVDLKKLFASIDDLKQTEER